MFCHCPAGRYTKNHDSIVLRHMRPTLSELGEYDGTALMEFKTKKNIVYLLHRDNVCTYEMDDTPPFLVNQQALDIAIEQCLMLGCDIIDEVHVTRKQYLDGSIPTGFQRTAIVGVGGKLPFRGRDLGIIQVSVEEDSCREVSDRGHLIVWRTDRLGMPLIETVTEPTIRTPEETKEAILLIGRVCRSTGHVRVGLGASRQDINVSIRGGRRIEIKGVSKAGIAPGLVHGEAVRQKNLLDLRTELHQRGYSKTQDIVIDHKNMTRFFRNSQLGYLKAEAWTAFMESEGRRPAFEQGNGSFQVRVIRLPGLAGTLNWPSQPDLTFAHELAGRVRVIATLDQQPILVHSEKWPDYEGSRQELERLRKKMLCNPDDSLVVVWGAAEDTLTAAKEIEIRYREAMEGIPPETRQPFDDGTTQFERILPGPDRMYPDTDSPPQRITRRRVEGLQANLAPTPWEREASYRQAGVAKETIYYLIRRNGADLVDAVVAHCRSDLRATCIFFGEKLKGLHRKGVGLEQIPKERWIELFEFFEKMPVLVQAWQPIVRAMAAEPSKTVADVLESNGLGEPPADWENFLKNLVRDKRPGTLNADFDLVLRFHMGLAMAEMRGKVPAQRVSDMLRTKQEQSV